MRKGSTGSAGKVRAKPLPFNRHQHEDIHSFQQRPVDMFVVLVAVFCIVLSDREFQTRTKTGRGESSFRT